MNGVLLITFFSISAVFAQFEFKVNDYNEEQKELGLSPYNVESLVKSYGYPFEKYTVTTDDGYALEIHRVSTSPKSSSTDNRPPVLIMHGLLGSSADFFHIGPGKSLPLRLADVGYDVWLGNNRGNSYSRKHKTLNPDKNDTFWNFSLHDIGIYDTPNMIDYILNKTQKNKLSYIGHSTGASQFYIMTSILPAYNSKVNIMAALAPIVYMEHTSSLLLQIVNKNDYPYILAAEKSWKLYELLQHNIVLDIALGAICKTGSKTLELCTALLFLITGFDNKELNKECIPQFLESFPAGTSTMELNHVLQMKITGQFKQYDYGKIENMEKYKNITPPVYDLSNVLTDVALYYSQNDLIVSVADIDHLAKDLPNVIEKHLIDYKNFNHIDYLLATDVDSLLNIFVINTLNSYNDLTTTTGTPETTTSGSSFITTTPFNIFVVMLIYFITDLYYK